MSISNDEIVHLAELARLDLDEDEIASLNDDLSEILELAEKIKDVDTNGVKPTYHAFPLTNVTREDEARETIDSWDVLEEAPDDSDGYFVVPRIIDDS